MPECGRRTTYLRGCRCDRCRAEENAYQRARRRAVANGRPLDTAIPPPESTIRRLTQWRRDGFTDSAIYAAVGIARATARAHRQDPTAPIRPTTIAAIETTTLHHLYAKAPDRAYVPALPTIRRLRALAAIGYGRDELTLLTAKTLYILRRGDRHAIYAETHRAVAAIYAAHHTKPGPNHTVAANALARGWLAPPWWDDDYIDIPKYAPNTNRPWWTDLDGFIADRAARGWNAKAIARRINAKPARPFPTVPAEARPALRAATCPDRGRPTGPRRCDHPITCYSPRCDRCTCLPHQEHP